MENRAQRLLFLLGDETAFDAAAEEFVPAAGGRDAAIALLLQGGEDWQEYVPRYTQPWIERGVRRHYPIAPDEKGELDLNAVSSTLHEATGVFIGGGHTPTYHKLYAQGPVGDVIRERWQHGIPVAGVSAGAMITLETCVLTPDETQDGSYRPVAGLGLITDVLIEVHFTEHNALPRLLDAMALTRTGHALGIDEPACAVFEDGSFQGALGRSVYDGVMCDFETKAHRASRCEQTYRRP